MISESIYFVLCVINVNSELKAALSPMGIGDTATHTDLHRISGIYIAWNNIINFEAIDSRGEDFHCEYIVISFD